MVITRFAPSPTGYLHIGSARTALFCWLWAQKTQGKFILRIEDTDLARSTQEAIDVILEGMQWLNLSWDEGPIYQTHRFERYKEVIQQLINNGHAYRCTCSKERLEALRNEQMQQKLKPRYDGHCRDKQIDANVPHVIRFKTPQSGSIAFTDMIKGAITVQNSELDDLIIQRTDGSPTYNFTVVVDDWDMGVTHVLRGDDHINNTPRQVHILMALGADIPEYGHMPMLLGPDGKKLSKRHGAASVLEYREAGVLPEALINYLVRLGWSYGDQEVFTLDELKTHFDIHNIQSAAAAVNPDKLMWLNQHYIKHLPAADIALRLRPFLEAQGCNIDQGPAIEDVVVAQRERCKTLLEMAQKSAFWFCDDITYDEEAKQKHVTPQSIAALQAYHDKLEQLEAWTTDSVQSALKDVLEECNLKMGKVGPTIRIAICGNTVSPPIDVTLGLLGKTKTLERIQTLITKLS